MTRNQNYFVMKSILKFLASLAMSSILFLNAQCPEGNVIFTSQADVNTFVSQYPDCENLNGHMTIGLGNVETDITDLSGLSGLSNIPGSILVQKNPNLTSLAGFENLQNVGNRLQFSYNNSLENLSQLNNLNSVHEIYITYNPLLQDLNGLQGLTQLNGNLYIGSNDGLINLNGLDNIQHIGGNLTLAHNYALETCEGLENLQTIGQGFYVEGNTALTNFIGLNNLQSIVLGLYTGSNGLQNYQGMDNLTYLGGVLLVQYNTELVDFSGLNNLAEVQVINIQQNPVLQSLDGLNQLSTLQGNIIIESNPVLSDISALANITSGIHDIYGLGSGIRFISNPQLSECSIYSICEYIGAGNLVTLYDNGTGCNTMEELENACQNNICDALLFTAQTYAETSDLNQNVVDEFGNSYSIADWNDLTAIADILGWIDCMNLQEDDTFLLTRDNAHFHSGNRHYFVWYSSDGVPFNGFAIHAQYQGLYLGSWYDLEYKILAKNNNMNTTETNAQNLMIYPNPCKDLLHIQNFPANASKLLIHNISGQLMQEIKLVGNKTELNTSHWQKGIYFISILDENGNQVQNKKVIK